MFVPAAKANAGCIYCARLNHRDLFVERNHDQSGLLHKCRHNYYRWSAWLAGYLWQQLYYHGPVGFAFEKSAVDRVNIGRAYKLADDLLVFLFGFIFFGTPGDSRKKSWMRNTDDTIKQARFS